MPLSSIGRLVSERSQPRSSQRSELPQTLFHSRAAARGSSSGDLVSRLRNTSSIRSAGPKSRVGEGDPATCGDSRWRDENALMINSADRLLPTASRPDTAETPAHGKHSLNKASWAGRDEIRRRECRGHSGADPATPSCNKAAPPAAVTVSWPSSYVPRWARGGSPALLRRVTHRRIQDA